MGFLESIDKNDNYSIAHYSDPIQIGTQEASEDCPNSPPVVEKPRGGGLGRFPAHCLLSFKRIGKLLIQLEQESHPVTIAQEFLF